MKIKEQYTAKVPTWALPALINGDYTGLAPEDAQTVKTWFDSLGIDVIVETTDGESYFSKWPEFGLPCEVENCEVMILDPLQENGPESWSHFHKCPKCGTHMGDHFTAHNPAMAEQYAQKHAQDLCDTCSQPPAASQTQDPEPGPAALETQDPEPEYPQVWTPDGMQHTFTAPDEPIQPNLF